MLNLINVNRPILPIKLFTYLNLVYKITFFQSLRLIRITRGSATMGYADQNLWLKDPFNKQSFAHQAQKQQPVWNNQAWNQPAMAWDWDNRRSKPNAKYKRVAPVKVNEQGKNYTSTVVNSRSKRTYAQKQWIRKDIVPFTYSLKDAALEVFFGQLAAKLHGKTNSPKTKFNPDRPGIVSRIIGDNNNNTTNLTNFVTTQINVQLNQTAKRDLMRALVFGVIIGDRDIAGRNVVVQRDPFNPRVATRIYGIDHEYSCKDNFGLASLKDFVPKALKQPGVLTDIIVGNTNKWSYGNAFNNARWLMDADIDKKLCDGITASEVQNEFESIANKIAANDFKICKDIKEEIREQVRAAKGIYTQSELDNVIMPAIDQAIVNLKENVKVVQEACEDINPGFINKMMHRIGAH